MHVHNEEYRNFIFLSCLIGTYETQKLKNLHSYNLWTCSDHMAILKSQNKKTDFFMILA